MPQTRLDHLLGLLNHGVPFNVAVILTARLFGVPHATIYQDFYR